MISDNEDIIKKIGHMIRLLPLEIHLLDFKTEEFIEMLTTIKKNVGKEIVKERLWDQRWVKKFKLIKFYA